VRQGCQVSLILLAVAPLACTASLAQDVRLNYMPGTDSSKSPPK